MGMNQNTEKHEDSRLYLFFEKLWRFDTIKWRSDLDFTKTFPQFLRSQWLPISLFSTFKILMHIYIVYVPILLAQVIQDKDIAMLWIVLLLAGVTYLSSDLGAYIQFRWLTSQQHALYTTANKLLVETDPVDHTTLSRGLVISKLNVFGRGFFSLIQEITGTMAVTIASILTVLVIFLSYDVRISLFLLIAFITQIVTFSFMRGYTVKQFKPTDIHRRDKNKKAEIVLITQKNYIRTIFATDEAFSNFKKSLQSVYVGIRTQGMTYTVQSSVVALTQLIIVGVVVSVLINQNVGAIEILALSSSLQRASQSVSSFARTVSKLNDLWLDVIDSWVFVQKNTNKSYPVID